MRRREYAYIVVTAAIALVWGFVFGNSWLLDGEGLAVIGIITAFPYLKSPKREAEAPDAWVPPPRSRINHYARISRLDNTSLLVDAANNPFERSLVADPLWPDSTNEDLRSLALARRSQGGPPDA